MSLDVFTKFHYAPAYLSIGNYALGCIFQMIPIIVVVALLFYVHGKHLRSCRDGQLT